MIGVNPRNERNGGSPSLGEDKAIICTSKWNLRSQDKMKKKIIIEHQYSIVKVYIYFKIKK